MGEFRQTVTWLYNGGPYLGDPHLDHPRPLLGRLGDMATSHVEDLTGRYRDGCAATCKVNSTCMVRPMNKLHK